eukprot:CAMPEP_0116134332 /NCGR_PEP_ID=MMETSP0329-20121206/10588_1 /TAXON_ID=697910 /ORGANISM="Pseudo-nitzschia arenysensis, Strain B593" /LENGTH=447 /DNA_ID=CAMNT_0003629033 /DNA_START=83 /DNA_END=1426 /DNA_ORIENTATION=-
MFEDSSSDEEEVKKTTTATPNDDDKPTEDESAKKKPSLDDDDDDDDDKEKSDEPEEKKKPSMAGLFDDSDESDEEFDDAGAVVGSSAPAKKKTDADEAQGGGASDTPRKERINRVQNASVLEADRPAEGTSLHMTKLPNVVAIQTNAFDEADYDEKEEEEQYKGYMHNMIRWRYKRDENGTMVREGGDLVRESNSKLVKWSDGSYTLHIGNEAFDIQNVDSSNSTGFPGLNGYVYLSQKATFQTKDDDDDDENEEQNGGTVLECVGPVASRLVAKPSSLQSESHKSLTVAVRQRTVKRAKIAQYMTEEDPEKLKMERIKYNEDADKLRQRKRATGGYRGGGGGRRGMNRSYLEADDDEGYDTVNIRALKKGSASNYDEGMDDYGDESDDDDYGQSYVNRNRKRLRKAAEEEDDDSDGEEEMVFDDDDEEVVNVHKKKKSTAVLDDDE